MAAYTAVGLREAWRRRLRSVAWAFPLASLFLAFALTPATRALAPLTVFTLALGLATVWLAYERDRKLARWPVALAGDGLVLLAVMWPPSSAAPRGLPSPHRRNRAGSGSGSPGHLPGERGAAHPGPATRGELFEAIQGATLLFLGFGGTARVACATGGEETAIALIAMGTPAVCYIWPSPSWTGLPPPAGTSTSTDGPPCPWCCWEAVLWPGGCCFRSSGEGWPSPLRWWEPGQPVHPPGSQRGYVILAAIQGGLLKGAVGAFALPAVKGWRARPPSTSSFRERWRCPSRSWLRTSIPRISPGTGACRASWWGRSWSWAWALWR